MTDRGNTTVFHPAWRDRAGFCGADVLDQPAGSISPAQRVHLRAVAEQIKMVHDLFAAFADEYAPFPTELVAAQTRELVAVGLLLARYAVADPGAQLPPGVFSDAAAQRDYERLRARGRAGRSAALRVVATALRETVALLDPLPADLTAPDMRNVYLQLLVSSRRQCRIVQAWSAR
ncbi:DUF2202 domain-containing protein [Actinoplanes auranticolor]|uniref:DUF2202 domain-containing protein n=1 Tax=Actinoplanes auranticolor TaxID=47988 RepID=A0A919W2T2_9ACTN|nr:DUF2202 domain-containing protein [Actinoplanes auranticolor]GIM77728.1 hypothetical protein Aau02nite_77370 [Actinoplanes auranticolor]